MAALISLAATALIIASPLPTPAKVLVLVPVVVALFLWALDEWLTARAVVSRVAVRDTETVEWMRDLNAIVEAEEVAWSVPRDNVRYLPLPLRSVPVQRKPGSAS